jgi:hypothetical protein
VLLLLPLVHSSNVHPCVAVGALVDVGLGDDEEDVLGAAEGNAGDALDVLQAELGDGLASLLLVPVVNGDGSACGDVGLASLRLVVRLGLDVDVLLLGLIGELFNTGVRHYAGREWGTAKMIGQLAVVAGGRALSRSRKKIVCKTVFQRFVEQQFTYLKWPKMGFLVILRCSCRLFDVLRGIERGGVCA